MESPSKALTWTGRVLSALPVLMLIMSGAMKLMKSPEIVENFAKYHYPEGVIQPLGIVELCCAVLFAIPQTSILGAILVTGYLGGAVATHVAAAEYSSAITPVVIGMIAWAGIGLRDARLRQLLPLKKPQA